MRSALIGFSALTSALLLSVQPGSAQYWQGNGTWCIAPPVGGGTWRCSFYSEAQCEATRSGAYSGSCVPSPAAEWDRREGKSKGKAKARQQSW